MTLQTGKIYKVKEGHEGKCKDFEYDTRSKYIQIISIKGNRIEYNILNQDKEPIDECHCFTEDDLELEEEAEEIPLFKGIMEKLNNLKISKEDVKVENECKIYSHIPTADGHSCECGYFIQNRKGDEYRKYVRDTINNFYNYKQDLLQIVIEDVPHQYQERLLEALDLKTKHNDIKYLSPSEAETLLEEKLGIKVKIKI